jgi:diadenosine tetraphosphate (Ap4A) HIT family hydrolase
MAYDPENIFAKILRNEIPADKVYEDEHVLAFNDIRPQAPVHVLVIPKGAYETWDAFADNASEAEQAALSRAVGKVARMIGASEGGYRVICNTGQNGGQEVPHLHLHILGGKRLGRMLSQD